MATISLREYHNNLNKLLRQNNTDRVIGHCKHILQYYPRNAQTYRYFGQALIATNQWRQAASILRRVLAVYPDDYDTHYGLYQIYQNIGDANAAIWHLERAYELNPKNSTLVDTLRKMYEQQGIKLNKLPLTSGGAARQFYRSGLYNQAIDTLTSALDRNPDRADLRLLLVRTLWDAGRPIDAAEVAYDLVQQLPDCYEANRTITELWLNEERPADAMPFISNMEQVDPYTTLELVQDEPVPDDAFTLEELDYSRVAQQELVASGAQLDFLADLDADSLADDLDLMDKQERASVGSAGDFFAAEVPPEWMDELDQMAETGAERTVASAFTDDEMAKLLADLGDDEDPLSWMAGTGTGVTDMLGSAKDTEADDPLSWMGSGGTGVTGMLGELNEGADDPLSWMEQSGSGLTGLLGDAKNAEEDSLSWMNQPGSGLTGLLGEEEDESELEDPLAQGGDPEQWMTGKPSDPNDPLAWMRGAGVEMAQDDEGADIFDPTALLEDDHEMNYQDPAAQNPMAWLGADYIDQNAVDDDAMDWMRDIEAEEPSINEAQTGPLPEISSQEEAEEILDWMSDDSDSILDEMLGVEALATGMLSDPDTGLDDIFSDVEQPAKGDTGWLDDYAEEQSERAGIVIDTDDLALDEEPEWLDEATYDEDVAHDVAPDEVNWMSEAALEESEDLDADDAIDWMDEISDDLTDMGATTDELHWEDEDGETDENPDWLSSVNDNMDTDALFDDSSDEEGDNWLDTSDDDMDWMTAESDVPLTEGDDMSDLFDDESGDEFDTGDEPDWMASLGDDDSDNELNWMDSDSFSGDTNFFDEEDAAEDDNGGDWLSELGGDDQEDTGDDGGDWLSFDEQDEGEEEEVQLDTAFLRGDTDDDDEEPDWLSAADDLVSDDEGELKIDTAFLRGDAEGEEEPDWLSAADDLVSDDEEEQPALDTDYLMSGMLEEDDDEEQEEQPDWLSSADNLFDEEEDQGEDFFTDKEPEEAFGGDWLSELGGDDQEDTGDDGGDWLSFDEEDEGEEEIQLNTAFLRGDTGAEDEPDWMRSADEIMGDDEEEETQEDFFAGSDMGGEPDWLSDIGSTEEAAPMVSGSAIGTSEPDWLSDIGGDDDEVEGIGIDESPEWLDDEEEQPYAEEDDLLFGSSEDEEIEDYDFDAGEDEEESGESEIYGEPAWLASVGSTDGTPLDDADDAPDWLASTDTFKGLELEEDESGDDFDFDESDEESENEFDFAEEPAATSEDFMVDEQPDWLSELGSEEEPEKEEQQPDWLSNTDEFFEDEEEEPEEEQQPDWLSNTDEFFEDEEEEPEEEQQPDWLSNADEFFEDEEEEPEEDLIFGTIEEDEGDFEFEESAKFDDFAFEEEISANEMSFDTDRLTPIDVEEEEELFTFDEGTLEYHEEEEEPVSAVSANIPDWLTYDPNDEILAQNVAGDELDVADVDVAPGWLNEMVPGLDLDFDAAEEEPIETEFIEAESHRSRTEAERPVSDPGREFGWVSDVIEAEGGDTPAETPSRSRFRFTRPPLWLRKQSSTQDAPLDEIVGDGGPVGEPAWLDSAFGSDDSDLDDTDELGEIDDFDDFDDNDEFDEFDDDDEFGDDFDDFDDKK